MIMRTVMPSKAVCAVTAAIALAGCATTSVVDQDGAFTQTPESLVALAAPYQNLNKVRLGPDDTCFYYLHEGPVEATWLPLRTPQGNPICQAASS